MRSLALAAQLLLIPLAAGLTCYTTNSKCSGDYCFSSTPRDDPSQYIEIGCLRGKDFFTHRVGQCWTDGWYNYCLCDDDLCNNRLVPDLDEGALQCSKDGANNCNACNAALSLLKGGGFTFDGCDQETRKSVNRIMVPQSCVHFQASKTENYVECMCDSGDFCGRKMAKQQKLNSKAVTCAMDQSGPDTCQGALCFITTGDINDDASWRGCLTNNDTLAPQLYTPGLVDFLGKRFIICDSDHCNDDWTGALSSIGITEEEARGPPTTTDPPSTLGPDQLMEAEFRAEWSNLMNSIGNAFSDLVREFSGGFHG